MALGNGIGWSGLHHPLTCYLHLHLCLPVAPPPRPAHQGYPEARAAAAAAFKPYAVLADERPGYAFTLAPSDFAGGLGGYPTDCTMSQKRTGGDQPAGVTTSGGTAPQRSGSGKGTRLSGSIFATSGCLDYAHVSAFPPPPAWA